jgi:hypothetical protein
VKALFADFTDDKPATMPKIRRQNLPPALLHHLLDRIRLREISPSQLGLFAEWLDTEPKVPNEKWFKRFPEMTVCGQGDLVKTMQARKAQRNGLRVLKPPLRASSSKGKVRTYDMSAAGRTRRGEDG